MAAWALGGSFGFDVEVTFDKHRRTLQLAATLALDTPPETARPPNEARLASGGSIPYDLFVEIPVHRAPDMVENSGLAVDGWVPVEKTKVATRFPNVYAVGDVTGLPMAKAVKPVCSRRLPRVSWPTTSHLRGDTLERPYEGAGTCYIEFGGGMVGMVEANFFGGLRTSRPRSDEGPTLHR